MTLTLKKVSAALAVAVPLLLSSPMASAEPPAPLTVAAPAPLTVAAPASGPTVTILAVDNGPQEALEVLQRQVADDISDQRYQLEGGGLVSSSDILDKSTGQINSAVFNQLSRKGKKQFMSDVVQNTVKYTDPNAPNYTNELAVSDGVDQETQTNWFRQLQDSPGVGTRMLTEILSRGVHADLTTGAAWFKPFSGPLSGFLGFVAIVVVSLMGIRSVIDLSYISLPYFQTAYDKIEAGWGGGGGGTMAGGGIRGGGMRGSGSGSGGGIKVVSAAARAAADESEKGGNPIWTYFKRAALEYIVLGLAILFLCFNYMWDFTGTILDVGMGLLGYN